MFVHSPDVNTEQVIKDGVAPDNFHGTSMFPEYLNQRRMEACGRQSDGLLRSDSRKRKT